MGIIGALIGILIACLVIGVIWYCIQMLLPLIPLGEPFATIVRVLLILIVALIAIYFILMLLNAAGIVVPFFGHPMLTRC